MPSSRLDAIYAQLKNLQSFKDEIMGDLEDFTEDFDQKSVMGGAIEVPEQFNDVVDIIVSDSRAKATERVEREERKED